jgi:hypothetical protein
MRRRRLRWAVGLAVLLAAGAFVLWPQPITPGLTRGNFNRVHVGMTLSEVISILGPPYGSGTEGGNVSNPDVLTNDLWVDGHVFIRITSNEQGRVVRKFSSWDEEPGLMGRLLDAVQSKWRRWFPDK